MFICYVFIYVYIFVCMYVITYIFCMYVYICMYTYLCICLCVYLEVGSESLDNNSFKNEHIN